eukprot:jgi/Botrbrau1/10722/Bobra.357_1s0023.1
MDMVKPSVRTSGHHLFLPFGFLSLVTIFNVVHCSKIFPEPTVLALQPPSSDAAYTYFVLAVYWPPATFATYAQDNARQLIGNAEASPGFWTHGLWPARTGKLLANCTGPAYAQDTMVALERSLAYYLRSVSASFLGLHAFWTHEWTAHGTCSGLPQLDYFLKVFRASASQDLMGALAGGGIKPSISSSFPASKLREVLEAAYPGALLPVGGLLCAPSPPASPPSPRCACVWTRRP